MSPTQRSQNYIVRTEETNPPPPTNQTSVQVEGSSFAPNGGKTSNGGPSPMGISHQNPLNIGSILVVENPPLNQQPPIGTPPALGQTGISKM